MFGFSSLRCIDCLYLDKDDKNKYGEYYCPEERKYVDPSSYTCKYFVSNFYVMTAYSTIKGLEYSNYDMLVLMHLRNNYMACNEKGIEFLEEYENIGPELAIRMLKDMYRTDVVDNIESNYIKPAVELTINGDYEMAQQKYIEMVDSLKIRYGYKEKEKIKRL